MPLLYVVAFLTGSFGVLFMVSEQTVFTSLVRPREYVEANSLLIGSRSLAAVAGKALGGLLVAALTAPVAILADALSFIASAFFVRRAEVPEPEVASEDSGGLAAGVRFIRETPLLRSALLGTATFNIFNTAFWALLVLFATHEMGLGSGAIGVALGVGALGSVVGSAAARAPGARLGLGRALIISFVLAAAPLLLVPLAVRPARGLDGALDDRRVRLRARRDGPRRQPRLVPGGGDPGPAALPRLGRDPGRQLGRAPDRRARGRLPRRLHRPRSDDVGRRGRRPHRRPLAAALADEGGRRRHRRGPRLRDGSLAPGILRPGPALEPRPAAPPLEPEPTLAPGPVPAGAIAATQPVAAAREPARTGAGARLNDSYAKKLHN